MKILMRHITYRLVSVNLHLRISCRISDTHEWRILDVWWLLVAHHANSGAHSSILKSFQSAFNRVPMDLKLVCQALQGHELSLKVPLVALHLALTHALWSVATISNVN